jgi:hypothetical protein
MTPLPAVCQCHHAIGHHCHCYCHCYCHCFPLFDDSDGDDNMCFSDLRLLALDEIENELIVVREAKIQQYLYRKVGVIRGCV